MTHQSYPPVALVTGATTGIGLAVLRELQRNSFRIIATARPTSLARFAELGIVESPSLLIRALDVTTTRVAHELFSEIERLWDGVDVLVNNAGIAYRSVVEQISEPEEQAQLATNYFGPMNLIRCALPTMRRKRSGHIINISSVGGMMAMPTMGAYSASKFALEGASESLWYELRPYNIHVTLVEPGFINSNSFKQVILSAGAKRSLASGDNYSAYYTEMASFIEKLMGYAWATPEDIASKIIRIINSTNPPLRAPVTPDAHLFALLRRALPRRIYHSLLYHCLPGISKWGHAANYRDHQ